MPDLIDFGSATARWNLPLLFASQAQKEFLVNEALARIDALSHPVVLGEASSPPGSPAEGDGWLVTSPATGAWAGAEGTIAVRQIGQWVFLTPADGMRVFDTSSQQFALFSGTWQKAEEPEEPSGGLVVDSEARAAIGALILALRAAGIFPSA